VPASSLLLVDSDTAAAESIGKVLSAVGYSITTVADPDAGFQKAGEHQLVIVDVLPAASAAIELCREIRATPALAAIPVLCIAQSDEVDARIAFLEAGADDVIARPFDGRELEARVEALLLRFQRSRDLAPALASDAGIATMRMRRIVAVFSPKGGVGTTTIATNIAMSIARRKPDKVCLIDMDLQFGQVVTHLNLEARHTLVDVVRDEPALREPELLRTYATRHDSGLHVIAAPSSPELAEMITPAHVDALLTTILGTYENVVIDAGSILDERTMSVFEHAEAVILPVYAEIAALKALHTFLDYLNEAGSIGAKATFVLNSMFAKEILKPRDVESALGTKIATDLPYDPFIYLKAVNEGNPVVAGAPRSNAAERLNQLAAMAFGEDGIGPVLRGAPIRTEQRRGGLLGGLRRR
jgi:pilus assembly protein CpaE